MKTIKTTIAIALFILSIVSSYYLGYNKADQNLKLEVVDNRDYADDRTEIYINEEYFGNVWVLDESGAAMPYGSVVFEKK